MGEEKTFEVFVRKATGLVREWSAWDTFMYNSLTAVILTTGAFTYFWAPWAFPGGGGNALIIGILVCGIIGGFTSILSIAVLLSSAMPRSGGDYIFQSRLLHGSVGFAFAFGFAIPFVLYWQAMGGWWVSAMGLSPMFTFFGYLWNNPALLALGAWFASPDGVFIVCVLVTVILALTLIPGMRPYLRLQWILFALFCASIVISLALYFTFPPALFKETFNNFMKVIAPEIPDYYSQTISTAKNSGFNPFRPFNWYDIFGVVTLAWWALAWTALWTVQNLGEIKRADSIKRLSWVFIGCLVFCTIVMTLTAAGMVRITGWEWLSSQSWEFYEGGSRIPFPPYNFFVAALLTSSPILMALIFLGFIANAVQQNYNCFIGSTRIMLASAFDRVTPEWLSRVSRRWHSPVNAIMAFAIGSVIVEVGWVYLGWGRYMIASMFTAGFVHFFTNLAAAVFPFKMPRTYAGSPAAKYKIGKIPLITIAGIGGCIFEGIMLWYYFTEPKLFVSEPVSLAFIIGVYIVLFAYYWINRWYKRRIGIDVDLASKEVPPE